MSEEYDALMHHKRQQADAIAAELVKLGAYGGSESDAKTDAVAVLRAAQFAPMGDNHHNAATCPFCSTRGELEAALAETKAAGPRPADTEESDGRPDLRIVTKPNSEQGD